MTISILCKVQVVKVGLITISTIFRMSKPNTEIYFMGDFNMDFNDKTNKLIKDLTQLLKSNGASPLIKSQTRIGQKASCLDQIFTNSNFISNSGTLDINLNDHLAIFCSRKKTLIRADKVNFEGRSYRNYIKEDFQENLINSDWRDFYTSNDSELCWDIIEKIIRREIDKMCPVKKLRVSKSSNVWITNEILEEIKDIKTLLSEKLKKVIIQLIGLLLEQKGTELEN